MYYIIALIDMLHEVIPERNLNYKLRYDNFNSFQIPKIKEYTDPKNIFEICQHTLYLKYLKYEIYIHYI